MYHSLYRSNTTLSENMEEVFEINVGTDEIYSDSAFYLKEIGKSSMMVADEALLDEAFHKNMAD